MNNQSLYNEFEAEIDEVQSTLLSTADDLTSPLSELVRSQIKHSQPPICAAVVLAVAKPLPLTPTDPHEEGEQRRKRILLAAALEMLHVALNIHRLLVNAALNDQQAGGELTLERSFIGSTILAGDYCFSRAAQMAAQTDHPRVVATFALALQSVSEGLLREQFQRGDQQDKTQGTLRGLSRSPGADQDTDEDIDKGIDALTNESTSQEKYSGGAYDDTRQLLRSGAHAAAQLVELPTSEQQQAIGLSQELASQWALYKQGTVEDEQPILSQWTEVLPARWQALHRWLNHQRANGELRPKAPA